MTHKEKRSLNSAAIKVLVEWELAYEATPKPEGFESYAEAEARWSKFEDSKHNLNVLCKEIGAKLADRSTAKWVVYPERERNGYWRAREFAEKCKLEYQTKNRAAFNKA